MAYITCMCGRKYTPRQKDIGFIQVRDKEKYCIRCADHNQEKEIEIKVFGVIL